MVIMGETGCGKSSLVSGMCAALGWTLDILNVHSGLSYEDIVEWVRERADACSSDETCVSVVLLDEINSCGSIGEILCRLIGAHRRRIADQIGMYCSRGMEVYPQWSFMKTPLGGVVLPQDQ